MIENSYVRNNGIRETALVKDEDGTLIDPDVFTWRIKDPVGNIHTYIYGTNIEAARASVGNYYIEILGDKVGLWTWNWESQNPYLADEGGFLIKPTEFD